MIYRLQALHQSTQTPQPTSTRKLSTICPHECPWWGGLNRTGFYAASAALLSEARGLDNYVCTNTYYGCCKINGMICK